MQSYYTIRLPRRSPRLEVSRATQTVEDSEERTRGTDDESERDVRWKRRHAAQNRLRRSRTRINEAVLQPQSAALKSETASLTPSIYRLMRFIARLALISCAIHCFSFLLLNWMCWIPFLRNNMGDLDCRICEIGTPWSHYLCEPCDTWARPLCKPCHTALRNYLPDLCGTSLVPAVPILDSADYTEISPISVNGQKISNSTQMLSKLVESNHALMNTSNALTDAGVLSIEASNNAYALHDGYLNKKNLQKELMQFWDQNVENRKALSNFVNTFWVFILSIRYDTTDLIEQLKHWELIRMKKYVKLF